MQKKKTVKVPLIGRLVQARIAGYAEGGMYGTIIDETRNTLKIQTEHGVKTLIKDRIVLTLDGKEISGDTLTGRVEERLKN